MLASRLLLLTRPPIRGATRYFAAADSGRSSSPNSTCSGDADRCIRDGNGSDASANNTSCTRGNKAIYAKSKRRNDDKHFFTSIVVDQDRDKFIKLHDPDCDIDHPIGHEMNEMEMRCEMFLYDGENLDGPDPLPIRWIDRRLRFFHQRPYDLVKNQLTLENGSYVIDEFEGKYDVMFPFPNILEYPHDSPNDPKVAKQVRYLDAVFLMTKSPEKELFWATVCAVSADGNVVAEAKAGVPSIKVNENDLVAFEVSQIMLAKRGPNWSTGRGRTKKRGRRKGVR